MFKLNIKKFNKICADVMGCSLHHIESKPAKTIEDSWVVIAHRLDRPVAMLVIRPDGKVKAYIWHRNNNVDPCYYTGNSFLFKRKLRQVLYTDQLFDGFADSVGEDMAKELRDRTVWSRDAFWVIMSIWSEFSRVPKTDPAAIIKSLQDFNTNLNCYLPNPIDKKD